MIPTYRRQPGITLADWACAAALLVSGYLLGTAIADTSTPQPTPQPTPAPRLTWPVESTRVIDGDTVNVEVLVSFRGRLVNVDTPELHKKGQDRQKAAAAVATAVTEAWVEDAEKQNQSIDVLVYRLGAFSRFEVDLLNRTTGQKLSTHLLAVGVAVSTSGKQHDWTDEELKQIERMEP